MRHIPFLDLKKQYLSIKNEIDQAMRAVINESAFIKGEYVESFEKNFAHYLNVKHCIGVGNGTDAIFIALKCLDIGPDDEVIVPANSFIATSEAVTLAGGKPVFVDCDEYYNIDSTKIEAAITPKTKFIIPVHLYGQPAEMDKILAIADKYRLLVIEDAAQAHGAEYKGKKIGTFGVCATFSFYPGKNLGAYGDGGAIVTSDDALAEKIRMFANHGRKDKYNHKFEGVNSRLDGLQAAILDIKLKHLVYWNEKRITAARVYDDGLKNCAATPKVRQDIKHVYHLYVIQIPEREIVIKKLKEAGIETGIHYPIPLPLLEAYKKNLHTKEDFPVAASSAEKILSLPIHENLTRDDQEYILDAVTKILKG